jgi:hypothetical protein
MTNEFLTDLFGDNEGIVYSPVKGNVFKQHFFEWPQERNLLEVHVNDFNKRDVYISPVLFNDKRIVPETFKGTNYLWTEFDGKIPTESIEPSMRIMSSQEGHEHWYWRLDKFETDKTVVEDITKRLAYHYGADLSVWDYQNVLRPPSTWNHKRNRPVTLLNKNDRVYELEKFLWVPIPPAGTNVYLQLGDLPTKEAILAKYKLTYDAQDLLDKPEIAKGRRSDALARFAHECAESGLSNDEMYVLLEDRDRAWGKFVGRTDRQKRLEGFISGVRSRRVVTAEILQEATEVYRFHDFMKTKITMKWAIEGLLPVAGSLVVLGKAGIGKSTFLLRMCQAVSLGKEYFLQWRILNRQRTLFVSLEMQHDELKSFFDDMKLSEEEQNQLQDWFHIWPIGHAYPFDIPEQQKELIKYIKLHKIDFIVIDSLGLSMYGAIKDDDAVKRLNSFLNEDVRKGLKCGYVFIHHLRKEGIEKKKEIDMDDSFGSAYISNNAQTIILLSQKPGSPRMHIKMLKSRMSLGEKEFDIERTPDRGFRIVGSLNPGTIPSTIITGGETKSHKKPDDGSLGKLFAL